MKALKRDLPVIISVSFIILLMLTPKIAQNGALEGIQQSVYVIIPSLFPYFFVTIYLNAWLLGIKVPGVYHLSKLLGLPSGGDPILLLGMIGGYPVGAQSIANTYQHGAIDRDSAHILLGYCNNAGPAFIFGVTTHLFSNLAVPWALWGVQILATICTGFILPKPLNTEIIQHEKRRLSAIEALQKSLHSIASVCGWIILFKILLTYLDMLPIGENTQVILSGLLELSNGCLALRNIQREAIRFILCSLFLSFGGICVLMQTKSSVGSLGLGYYLPGKIIQTMLSILFSPVASFLLFKDPMLIQFLPLCIACIFLIIAARQHFKKSCGISAQHGI